MTMIVEGKISELAGTYKGKRCWIVGSGPSLDSLDLSLIPKNDTIFALNAAITLFTDQGKFPNA